MYPDPSLELSILWEKFRALQTLVRYERDISKLQVYKRELEIVNSEVQRVEEALEKRRNAKVLRFAPKNPSAPPDLLALYSRSNRRLGKRLVAEPVPRSV